MKAIVQDTYVSADVLELRDVDKPAVGHGGVLVGVHAAGVKPGVWRPRPNHRKPLRSHNDLGVDPAEREASATLESC